MVWAVRLGKLRRGFRFPRRDLLVYSQRLAVALDPTLLLYPLPLLATSTPRLTLYDPVTTQRQLSLLREPEFRILYRHICRVDRIAQSKTRNVRCTEPQTDLWIRCALEHGWNRDRSLDTEGKEEKEKLSECKQRYLSYRLYQHIRPSHGTRRKARPRATLLRIPIHNTAVGRTFRVKRTLTERPE